MTDLEKGTRVHADSSAAGRSTWVMFLAPWAFFAALFALWAFATPIGAAPDEPAHLIKAASVVRGQLVGESTKFGHTVQVPEYIAHIGDETCFAFNLERAANCPEMLTGDPRDLVEATTTAGLYNPVYYAIVGWPSLVFGDEAGIYAMRLTSALLTSGLIALSFMLVAGWRRRVLPTLGLLTALTPMVLFLGGVVNPSGPEIAGTLTAVVAAVSIVLRRDPARFTVQVTAMTIGAAVALNMRGISPLWVAVGLAVPLAIVGWRRFLDLLRTRAARVAVAVIVTAAVLAMAWTFFSNSLGTGMEDDKADAMFPGVGTQPLVGFGEMLLSTFDLARGIVGLFGWTETSAPAFAFFFWSALTGGLIAFGAAVLRGRLLLVFGLFLGATVILPAAVQAAYVTEGGYIWQGRYTIPVFAALVFVAAALLDEVVGESFEAGPARRMLAVLTAVWAFAQFDAFLRVLRRYAEGWPSAWGEFFRTPDWAPPGGTIALPLAFAVVTAGFAVWIHRGARRSIEDDLDQNPSTRIPGGPKKDRRSSFAGSL